MLGPAEFREIIDALNQAGLQPVRLPEGRSPYLSPVMAAGMAVPRALRKARKDASEKQLPAVKDSAEKS
ncbi:hypothetical protein A6A04_00665 [Paramagnetospirillum marisnigri]|uniref:Uncharacterized protein n=1 Tax=Paramagnetospirillum marisnigri TaxID=1285242 RepID=A0A178MRM2_9PROT|nr:hypothetical protein [Paramagnetospirillum marisnigri]OAN52241.1 hypothetical protein A6A04_00665 [Paramagnetospirillum marisnigri]